MSRQEGQVLLERVALIVEPVTILPWQLHWVYGLSSKLILEHESQRESSGEALAD